MVWLLGWDSLRPTVSHSWSYLLVSGLLLPTQHLLQHLAVERFLPLLYICVHWTLLQDASERAGGRDGRMEENQTEDEAWLHLGQQPTHWFHE